MLHSANLLLKTYIVQIRTMQFFYIIYTMKLSTEADSVSYTFLYLSCMWWEVQWGLKQYPLEYQYGSGRPRSGSRRHRLWGQTSVLPPSGKCSCPLEGQSHPPSNHWVSCLDTELLIKQSPLLVLSLFMFRSILQKRHNNMLSLSSGLPHHSITLGSLEFL